MGQEKMGLSNPGLIQAMGAFGGGVASSGRVCGILVGAVALVSSLYSRASPEETEDRNMWRYGAKLTRRFEQLTQEFGSVDCRDIARVDWRDREAVRDFYHGQDGRREYCVRLLGDMTGYLGELLETAPAKNEP